MKQADLAKILMVSPQWMNAIVRGRKDGGKAFAQKAASLIGGTMEVWMLEGKRKARKEIVDNYMTVVNQARKG